MSTNSCRGFPITVHKAVGAEHVHRPGHAQACLDAQGYLIVRGQLPASLEVEPEARQVLGQAGWQQEGAQTGHILPGLDPGLLAEVRGAIVREERHIEPWQPALVVAPGGVQFSGQGHAGSVDAFAFPPLPAGHARGGTGAEASLHDQVRAPLAASVDKPRAAGGAKRELPAFSPPLVLGLDVLQRRAGEVGFRLAAHRRPHALPGSHRSAQCLTLAYGRSRVASSRNSGELSVRWMLPVQEHAGK